MQSDFLQSVCTVTVQSVYAVTVQSEGESCTMKSGWLIPIDRAACKWICFPPALQAGLGDLEGVMTSWPRSAWQRAASDGCCDRLFTDLYKYFA